MKRVKRERRNNVKEMAGLSQYFALSYTHSVYSTDWHWDMAMRLCFPRIFSMPQYSLSGWLALAKSLKHLELQWYRVARRRELKTANSATHIVLSTCQKYVVDFFHGTRHRFHYWAPAKRPIRNFLTFVFFLFSLLATSHQAHIKHDSAHKLWNG